MRILVDMNLSPAWAKFLSGKDVSAIHWSGIGAANATDREIMAYAAEHDFVVRTHDPAFGATLAATRNEKPGSFRSERMTSGPKSLALPLSLHCARPKRTSIPEHWSAWSRTGPGCASCRSMPAESSKFCARQWITCRPNLDPLR